MPAAMTEREGGAALLHLLTWTSPAFPVGAYAFSHGLEAAVEAGCPCNAGELERWIGDILARGAGRCDGILLAHAWRVVAGGDAAGLQAVADLAEAFRGTAELALESSAEGRAFVAAVQAGWPALLAGEPAATLARRDRPPAYAIAVGAAAAAAGIGLDETLIAFLQAFAANLVSAGVRLIPLGQSEGLKVLAGLEQVILGVAGESAAAGLDDLGSATWGVEIGSARHETQYTRLFRS